VQIRLEELETAVFGKVGKDLRFETIEKAITELKLKQINNHETLASELEAVKVRSQNEFFAMNQNMTKVNNFEQILETMKEWL